MGTAENLDLNIEPGKRREFDNMAQTLIDANSKGLWHKAKEKLKGAIVRQLAYVYSDAQAKTEEKIFKQYQSVDLASDSFLLEFILKHAEVGILVMEEDVVDLKVRRINAGNPLSVRDDTGYLTLKRVFLIKGRGDIVEAVKRYERKQTMSKITG